MKKNYIYARFFSGLQGFVLGIACLLTQNSLAKAIEATEVSSESTARENRDRPCEAFIPITNTLKPTVSLSEYAESETLVMPNSSCASDLMGVPSAKESIEKEKMSTGEVTPTFIIQESPPKSLSESPDSSEKIPPASDARWHFKLQPYATIPLNTYGTVSARGETVSYHLSLGELLDTVRVAASGRFEGWKGRWGFIIDGYFASLQDIGNLQIVRSRTPNPINTLNFLLNNSVNTKLQQVVDVIDREIQVAKNIKEVRDEQPFQNFERQFQGFKAIASQDAQDFRELEFKLQEFQDAVITGRQQLEVLEVKRGELQELGSQIDTLKDLDLNSQRLKRLLSLNVQDLSRLNSLQELNNQIQESNRLPDPRQLGQELRQTGDNLERVSRQVRELRDKQDSEALQNLDVKIEEAKALLDDGIITDRQKLERLQVKLEELQNIDSKIDVLEDLDLNSQRLKRLFSLSVQDLPILDDLQELNDQIQTLNRLSNISQLGQELRQTRENLERVSQRVKELRDKQDSEALQNLDVKIEEAKALLDREIQAVDKIQEFVANQQPQQLTAGVGASLQFDQGIYDFAISYHIGDLPAHELPDQPSNRPFPLIWFQPIAGVRLNDISIDIETITNFEISSSLVNIQGTVQQNFRKDRTWFEPLLGGKFGIQVSDPLIFWLRGDASGFGLAGETDISWNLLFGVDWWVHRQISLQLGYRFYEIDYKNSRNNDDFGFEENFNGPFLSATFHF